MHACSVQATTVHASKLKTGFFTVANHWMTICFEANLFALKIRY